MERIASMLGGYAPDFELPGTDGSVHHLARYLERLQAICVVFLSNHCPIVHLYLDRLKQIQADFESQGFTLVGINANDITQSPGDNLESMKQFAAKADLNFPYLRDVTQDVGHSFEAQVTPQAFLLDKNGVLCYIGSIDDSPENPAAVKLAYLNDAIKQLLATETITTPWTEAIGSPIIWRA
jgi:peroxiredoxin